MTSHAAPIRTAFVLHVMQVAGAEVLVAETIRRLGPRLTPVVFCLDGVGELGKHLQAEGVPVVDFGRRPGLDFSVARRMAHEIAARKIEIVHAHQYTPFFYSALARLWTRQHVHVMFTEHGRHYPDVVSRKRRVLNRLFIGRMADEVNGVCQFSVRSLAERDGFASRPLEVIENGIDLERYGVSGDAAASKARVGLSTDRRYLACIARFHPVKDHRMLLEAFALVARESDDVDLLLAGDGQLRSELEALANSLNISPRVKFLGVRQDVPDILAAAEIFLLTSVSEAASITLLEAMATAKPSVVTDVGGNREILRDGVDGILVPRGDSEATARAVLSLLNSPQRAREMGLAARGRVEERFQLKDTVAKYYQRYAAAAARLRGAH